MGIGFEKVGHRVLPAIIHLHQHEDIGIGVPDLPDEIAIAPVRHLDVARQEPERQPALARLGMCGLGSPEAGKRQDVVELNDDHREQDRFHAHDGRPLLDGQGAQDKQNRRHE